MCNDISNNWGKLQKEILNQTDNSVTVNMQYFVTKEIETKSGNTVKRLKAISAQVDLEFLVDFISRFLNNFIHPRNQLKHYRNCIGKLREALGNISIDIDFSEHLSVPVKFEPQTLHWTHQQITVHSGTIKQDGEKSYHPYLSDDVTHDQKFVKIAMDEMLSKVDNLKIGSVCLIESDNCTSQYKSAENFSDLHDLCNSLKIVVVRAFGVAAHGKGEVDHVGGLAKVAIRRQIAEGDFFANAEDMVDFLTQV